MIDVELLRECHKRLDEKKAMGVDEVSKEMYEENLEENLMNLVASLKSHTYRTKPALRVYIPKANGKQRPLNISCYEDKLVQYALKCVLEAVFEPLLLDSMYGFRPNRGCHGALKAVTNSVEKNLVTYVLDADIKGFFDNLDQTWIIKMIGVHIKDPNIIWLTKKILNAGYIEDGSYHKTCKGAGQGSLCSPIIANIYMHYMMNLWFQKSILPTMKGYSNLVIYADDFVGCFRYKSDADRFKVELEKRMNEFGLELEETKTRLIKFGRFAEKECRDKGVKSPTFNFLGFTHYLGISKLGRFRVKRKTEPKKFRSKIAEMKKWLKLNRTKRLKELIPALNLKLSGHYHYFGITDNFPSIHRFYIIIHDMLYKWLNRRSQKRSYNFAQFEEMLKVYPLVKPRIFVNIYKAV